MSEESEQMLMLLQEVEVAVLKEQEKSGTPADTAAHRKRRKEISEEIKRLARARKNRSSFLPVFRLNHQSLRLRANLSNRHGLSASVRSNGLRRTTKVGFGPSQYLP